MTTTPRNVLAAIAHAVLNDESFDNLADLADAVKFRAARLRIPYDAGRVSEALDLVARTRPLTRHTAARATNPGHVEVEQGPDPVPRGEAGAVFADVVAGVTRYRAGHP